MPIRHTWANVVSLLRPATRFAFYAFFIGSILGSLFGCALTTKRANPTKSGTASAAPAEETSVVPDMPLPEGSLKAEAKDFRQELQVWAQKNTKANYKSIAKQAQKYVNQMGLQYQVDVKQMKSGYTGYKFLTLESGRDLYFSVANAFEGPCGEQFTKVSVMGFENGNPIVLTSEGPIVVKGLKLEKTLLRKASTDFNGVVIYRPRPEPPWNVTSDGNAILWQYDLKQSLLTNWWQRLARRYRELREERPFVVIRITETTFVVESYEKILLPAVYEQVDPQVPDDPYLMRRVYKPKGITVDYLGACT